MLSLLSDALNMQYYTFFFKCKDDGKNNILAC